MGRYQGTVKRLGHTRGFASVMKHIAPTIDRVMSRVTRGKRTFADSVLPTLILVHTGRKSGRTFRTPLSYLRIGDAFVLTASNWGQPHHPRWSENLLTDPNAQLVVDGTTIDVRARHVDDEEKAELWPKLTAMWPAYNTYETRSGRNIRVFVLERR